MKVLVIDDEQQCRQVVENLIRWFRPDFPPIAQASTLRSGIEAIDTFKPELVFLDIRLGDGTAFELLKEFPSPAFKIVFTTAFDEYAISAFKYSALDYLLKPIDPQELQTVLDKAEKIEEKELLWRKLNSLSANFFQPSSVSRKLVLSTTESIHFVNTEDIIRCEAFNNYTEFYFQDGKKILVSVTLKEYDQLLSDYGFFRCHQSHLINLSYLDRFDKRDGGALILKDKSMIPLSSRQKGPLLQILKSL